MIGIKIALEIKEDNTGEEEQVDWDNDDDKKDDSEDEKKAEAHRELMESAAQVAASPPSPSNSRATKRRHSAGSFVRRYVRSKFRTFSTTSARGASPAMTSSSVRGR